MSPVRAVLSEVELGEADAGPVHDTDVESAQGKVDAVEIPGGQNAVAPYSAATLKGLPGSGERAAPPPQEVTSRGTARRPRAPT